MLYYIPVYKNDFWVLNKIMLIIFFTVYCQEVQKKQTIILEALSLNLKRTFIQGPNNNQTCRSVFSIFFIEIINFILSGNALLLVYQSMEGLPYKHMLSPCLDMNNKKTIKNIKQIKNRRKHNKSEVIWTQFNHIPSTKLF